MSKLRALTIDQYLEIDIGDMDSKEVLELVCAKVSNYTTNTLVTTYDVDTVSVLQTHVALELMFRFGWELAELSRLTRIRDLSMEERREVDELLLRL